MTDAPGRGIVRVGVLGASGYTGAELVRLLLGHRNVEIAVLTGNTQAGQEYSSVYPQFHYAKVIVSSCQPHASPDVSERFVDDHPRSQLSISLRQRLVTDLLSREVIEVATASSYT